MRLKLAAIVLLLAVTPSAMAASCHIEKRAALPITYNKAVPTVPVTINGQTLTIGIDTGAEHTTVTPETATALHMPPDNRHYDAHIMGTAGAYDTVNAVMHSMVFAGVEYKAKRVSVVQLRHISSQSQLKDPNPSASLTGLIGTDILSDFDVEYDPAGHMLTLYHVSGCSRLKPTWEGKYDTIPITFTDANRVIVPVQLDGHRLHALFDTGASGENVARSSAIEAGLTLEMLAHDRPLQGTGAGGNAYRAVLHKFDSFVIGHETFHEPFISVVNFQANDADMLLGEDYMHGRRFWISYATRTMFIQRVPH